MRRRRCSSSGVTHTHTHSPGVTRAHTHSHDTRAHILARVTSDMTSTHPPGASPRPDAVAFADAPAHKSPASRVGFGANYSSSVGAPPEQRRRGTPSRTGVHEDAHFLDDAACTGSAVILRKHATADACQASCTVPRTRLRETCAHSVADEEAHCSGLRRAGVVLHCRATPAPSPPTNVDMAARASPSPSQPSTQCT